MNPDLELLQPYPFERLRALLAGAQPPQEKAHIPLSIGEPRHPAPARVLEVLAASLAQVSQYPTTAGEPALREAIAEWLGQRFALPAVDPATQVLPVTGTREALFAIAQACVDRSRKPVVVFPNPFYQIYEGAALLAGAEPVYLDCRAENGFLPDPDELPDAVWARCELLYLCTPGNPTGAVMPVPLLRRFLEKASRFGFTIASDECYSEIYRDESAPPPGILQACAEAGNAEFEHCIAFHSLSKRSNLPGLRSGFVAGDAKLLGSFLLYRTYHGCAMPPHHQAASIAAWRDETHVRENRDWYREKFNAVTAILADALPCEIPEAGFYLWPQTPVSDTEFARGLFEQQHVTVLPGSFIARDPGTGNPGAGRVRMALVAERERCAEAAHRIAAFADSLQRLAG